MPRMASRLRPPVRRSGARVRDEVGPAAAAVSTGVLLVTVAGSLPDYPVSSFELGLPTWLIAIGLLAGLAMVTTAWVVSTLRPSVSVGLTVATVGLFVPAWAGWTTLPGVAQALVLAVAPIAIAGVSHVGLRWSEAGRSPVTLGAIYVLAAGAAVVHAVGYDPLTDPGCASTCAAVRPFAAALLSSRMAYALATALTSAAAIVAVISLVRDGARDRSGVVVWAALLAVVVLAVPWIAHVVTWTDVPSLVAVVLPDVVAGLLIGIAPLVAVAATRRVRLEVRELVEHLTSAGTAASGGGSPIPGVAFAIPDEDRWVDSSGTELGSADVPARAVVVSDPAGPALRLDVAQGADAGAVLATLTPATMLALQNARLAAVSLARLGDVRASQRRIVDASDAERQRIERDLHDGAQQRLVSASFQLSLARNRMNDGSEALTRAEASLREALARLRDLGHGIFPATITAEGLAAALEDLAGMSRVPTTLDVQALGLDRDVAVAAYAVVATALASVRPDAGPSSADIAAAVRDGSLELRVRLAGTAGPVQDDLVDVADRVGAVGGRLLIEPFDGGVVLTAEMPCV